MRAKIKNILEDISRDLLQDIKMAGDLDFNIVVPDSVEHGDYATNIAMQLSRHLKKSPKLIAEDILDRFNSQGINDIRAEIAGVGFINFYVDKSCHSDLIKSIAIDESFFKLDIGKGQRVLIEFVSANPTGPLHIGHGRGAAYGDSLARLLSATGHDVECEYYINDSGKQMNNLGLSVYARAKQKEDPLYPFPENGYHGEYILGIANMLIDEEPDFLTMDESKAIDLATLRSIEIIMKDIVNSLSEFRVSFNNFFSEKTLYNSHSVDILLDRLEKLGDTYIKDGALWFSSSKYGDDKDRVLQKSTGDYTYLTPDIAYHVDKYERGYQKIINIWGADHHGYVKRMQSAIKALGYDDTIFHVQLIQMVSLIKNGERTSMSTRSGDFIPLSSLINEVGVDATRYFYNMRNYDSQFDFDIELAKSKSSDNPVYYVQYAHARVYSLLANAKDKGHNFVVGAGLDRLVIDSELQIIRFMVKFKDVLEQSVVHLEPHRVTYYLQELASLFHSYYYANKIIIESDKELTDARLTLSVAVSRVIKFGLDILGVESLKRM